MELGAVCSEIVWVLDISSVQAFDACWQPQYEL